MHFLRVRRLFSSQVFRYSIAGGIGFISNIALFTFFLKIINFPPIISAFVAYCMAAIQNYLVNFYWSFGSRVGGNSPNFFSFIKFVISTSIGVAINLVALSALINFSIEVITSQVMAVVISFIANYYMAKKFVYS